MAILIVDDSPEILNLLSLALGMRGFGIITAHNGQQALVALEQSQTLPALILSNMFMPIMDGLSLLAAVRGSALYAHIPFLLMTAAPQPEIRDEAFQLGANEFIAKPFKLEVIIRIVQQFVTPP
jgi:CheY-like chemotaxis protein